MGTPPPEGTERERRFRDAYTTAYPDLLRFVSRRVHPSHAEDVVAETFLVAWRRLDDLPDDPGGARAWLFGTARRYLLNDRRGDRRRGALAVRIADEAARAPDQGFDPDMVARRLDLAAAWRLLTPADQEVIALTAWDGLGSPQAAAVLGISPVAYRLRLSRARRALRRHLDAAPPVEATRAPILPKGQQS